MLGDIQDDIATFVNEALRGNFTNAQLAVALQMCLNELSNRDFLIAQDTSQTLTSSSLTLDYPTDFKSLISIVLIDSSSVRQQPLKALPGGYREYCELRDNDAQGSEPEWYAEHRRLFHLWRPSSTSYTSQIDYYRYHPQTPADILFADEFRNAIYFGTSYWKANLQKRITYRDHWRPLYYNEIGERRINMPETPRFVRG